MAGSPRAGRSRAGFKLQAVIRSLKLDAQAGSLLTSVLGALERAWSNVTASQLVAYLAKATQQRLNAQKQKMKERKEKRRRRSKPLAAKKGAKAVKKVRQRAAKVVRATGKRVASVPAMKQTAARSTTLGTLQKAKTIQPASKGVVAKQQADATKDATSRYRKATKKGVGNKLFAAQSERAYQAKQQAKAQSKSSEESASSKAAHTV